MTLLNHGSTLRAPIVAAGLIALAAGPALAAERRQPGAADEVQALRDEVARLSALETQRAEQDRARIDALSAEVADLKTRLASAPEPIQTLPKQTLANDHAIAEPRVVQNAARRFQLQSADGAYSIGLTGDVQFDSGGYAGFRPDSRLSGPQSLSNGVNARRARIGVTGVAGGNFAFALVYDAGNSSDQTAKGIETAQIVYTGFRGAALEAGYSNTFFTLDQATGSNDTLFLERASPSNIATAFNTGDARSNAGIRLFGDRYWVGGYVTGPASGDSHSLTGETVGAFQRVAVQALSGADYSLHLGLGVDELLRAANSGNGTPNILNLSDQPELRIDPTKLVNTGTIGTAANPVTGGYVLDVETAATFHSLFWQGEYYRYQVDRLGLPSDSFAGGYGEVSWTLTGEHRAYNPQAGAYFRISPRHPFSPKTGDWGAWEVAARVTYIDLNSHFDAGQALAGNPSAVDGGTQLGYTVGVNWYPNDLIRFLLDYNHVDYRKAAGAASAGVVLGSPVGASFDAISLRAQVAY